MDETTTTARNFVTRELKKMFFFNTSFSLLSFFPFKGKYEEMKALCIEYRDRYLSTSQHDRINKTLNETRDEAEAEESKKIIETSDEDGRGLGTNEKRNTMIIDGEEEFEQTVLSTEQIEPLHEDEEGK